MIVSETFKITGFFVIQLQDIEGNLEQEYADVVKKLHQGIMVKLQKQDIAQEVKQNSIVAMAQLIKVSHKVFSDGEIDTIIKIFGERLNNDLTRESALRAFTVVAQNEAGAIKLKNLGQLTPKFTDLLHKVLRQIHLSTLEALNAILNRYADQFSSANASQLQKEISQFVIETDLLRSQLAIKCGQKLLKMNKAMPENK